MKKVTFALLTLLIVAGTVTNLPQDSIDKNPDGITIPRTGIYHLPLGVYKIVARTDEGFASPDQQTKQFVYRVRHLRSKLLLDVSTISPPDQTMAVGAIMEVIAPGTVSVTTSPR